MHRLKIVTSDSLGAIFLFNWAQLIAFNGSQSVYAISGVRLEGTGLLGKREVLEETAILSSESGSQRRSD